MSSEVDVNHIVRASKNLTIKNLIKLLEQETCNLNQDKSLNLSEDIAKLKQSVSTILSVYFSKLDQSHNSLKQEDKTFLKLLKEEMQYLKSLQIG